MIAQQQKQNDEAGTNILTSRSARLWTDEHTKENYIVLENGERYFGEPGQANYQQMSFDRYGARFVTKEAEYNTRERLLATGELRQKNTPKSRAELQWRYSLHFLFWFSRYWDY